MRKQSCNLKYGNKRALILTLDAFLALIVVLIVLGAASSYIARSENVMPNIQTARIGSDIAKLLENIKSLDTLDATAIRSDMSIVIPSNYGMRLNVSWANSSLEETGSFEIGDELPNKKFISTGKRFFVVITNNSLMHYGLVKYWIWLK